MHFSTDIKTRKKNILTHIITLSFLPCLHLSLDPAPSLCQLIGSVLVTFQLRAAVWVEPAERRPRLSGSIYLRLQSVKDVLVLSELSLPILERD